MALTTTALLAVQLMLAMPAAPQKAAQVKTDSWVQHKSKSGITLRVPPQFMTYDVSSPEFKRVIEKTRNNNSFIANAESSHNNFDLYMFDGSDDGLNSGYTDNLNISIQNGGAGIRGDDMLKAVGEQVVKSLPSAKPMQYELVTLPAGRALRYWGTLDMNSAENDKIRPSVVGYFLVKGDKIVVLTMGTREGNLAKMEPTFRAIAESLRVN